MLSLVPLTEGLHEAEEVLDTYFDRVSRVLPECEQRFLWFLLAGPHYDMRKVPRRCISNITFYGPLCMRWRWSGVQYGVVDSVACAVHAAWTAIGFLLFYFSFLNAFDGDGDDGSDSRFSGTWKPCGDPGSKSHQEMLLINSKGNHTIQYTVIKKAIALWHPELTRQRADGWLIRCIIIIIVRRKARRLVSKLPLRMDVVITHEPWQSLVFPSPTPMQAPPIMVRPSTYNFVIMDESAYFLCSGESVYPLSGKNNHSINIKTTAFPLSGCWKEQANKEQNSI